MKRLNAMIGQFGALDFATAPVFVVNGLKREELIAANSMILHELYLDGLGAEGEPDTALREALTGDFVSIERWRTEFVAMGGGSGWVLLTYSPRDRKLVNQWAADHTHGLATPILALDTYEHSYHLDYGAAAAKYVDAFMENIRGTTFRGCISGTRDEQGEHRHETPDVEACDRAVRVRRRRYARTLACG